MLLLIVNSSLKIIIKIVVTYLLIGFVLVLFLPYRLNSCPKCPPGALCNICPAFEDNTYSPLEIITFIFTRRFWISVLVWPLIVLVNISEMIDARRYNY